MPSQKKSEVEVPQKRKELTKKLRKSLNTKERKKPFTKDEFKKITGNTAIEGLLEKIAPSKKNGKRTLVDKVTEAFNIKEVLAGKDETKQTQTSNEDDLLVGEVSKPISHSKKQATAVNALQELFPTLNKSVLEAEELLKMKEQLAKQPPQMSQPTNPLDRPLRAACFESETRFLNQIVSDLRQLVQYYIQKGMYDNIVEYTQLLVSFAEKAKAIKPTIGRREKAKPVILPNDHMLDHLLIEGKVKDVINAD